MKQGQSSSNDLIQLAANRLRIGAHDGSRAASKYDFVKVRVWLGEDMAHYYVLSRFLMSRTLTVTKVPNQKAIKIALDVKKYLVDNDRLDVRQAELEAILFSVMRSMGFGDEFVDRYKMVNQFFQQKRPLIILICGSACTGKSTFAQHLASRLNLPNVLQTDILYELLRTSEWGQLSSTPLWSREGLRQEELVSEFQDECRIIRRGLEGDLCKCIKDGKPIIIEGLHLDPGLYLDEFGRHGCIGMGGITGVDLPAVDAAAAGMPLSGQHGQQQMTDSVVGSAADSQPGSPLSPSGPFSGPSSEQGDSCASPSRGSSPPPTPSKETSIVSAPGPSAPHSPATSEEQVELPARRSASFNTATASGLAYTSPGYSKSSPWKYLQRLLQRPGSAKHPPPPAAAGPLLRQLHSLPVHAGTGLAATAQQQQQQQPRNRPFLRTASAGQVTFMLQQPEDSALAPTPVMPGTEVVVPASGTPKLLQPAQPTLAEEGEEFLPTAECNGQRQQQQQHALEGGGCLSAGVGGPGSPTHTSAVGPCQSTEAGREGGEPGQPASSPQQQQQQPAFRAGTATQLSPLGSSMQASRTTVEEAQGAGPTDSAILALCPSSGPGAVGGAAAAVADKAQDALPSMEDSAAAAPPPPSAPSPREPQQGPVFVPIVLSMDGRDYELVIQEWLAVQAAYSEPLEAPGRGDEGGEGDASAAVLRRLQILQSYLNSYRAVGVPVVEVTVGNFTETLDKLHDYLLECIRMSL